MEPEMMNIPSHFPEWLCAFIQYPAQQMNRYLQIFYQG